MAYIVNINYDRYLVLEPEKTDDIKKTGEVIPNFPVLVKKNGVLWVEGCAYLATLGQDVLIGKLSLKTVKSYAWQLLSYLNYCETNSLEPMAFGPQRLSKPSYLFRGHLVKQRDGTESKKLRSTTVSSRMNAVARFFDWAITHGWLEESAAPFRIKSSLSSQIDRIGFSRKITIQSTDLAIRKSRHDRNTLEGGLQPVSMEVRDKILTYANKFSSSEFALMLEIGFLTGLRIQSICALHIDAILNATPGESGSMYYFNIGPKFGIATKFGVNYSPQIPDDLLEKIKSYIYSRRRQARVDKADERDKNLVFLNRWGNRYNEDGSDQSSVGQDLHRLRKRVGPELDLTSFYFHCTRATFGTSIVIAGLNAGIPVNIILGRLKELLGHKDIATALKYVSFVEAIKANEKIDEELKR